MQRRGFVYIATNPFHTVLYTGVTADIERRMYEHQSKHFKGFTADYNVTTLIYVECFDSIEDAIVREKQIKGKTRAKKIKLIEAINPEWKDLMRS